MARCDFCAHGCTLQDAQVGLCGVRKNSGGQIHSLYPNQYLSPRVDPVEKKPLYHFLPGTGTLSLGSLGCSLDCSFCQNSQLIVPGKFPDHALENWTPQKILQKAVEMGVPSLSFTYSEPTVWQDSMIPVAQLAQENRLRTIMVSNGFFSKQTIMRLLPLITAFNIDLKGDGRFYRSLCRGRLAPVLESIAAIAKSQAHLEVTTLVVTGEISIPILRSLGKHLKDSGVKIWHLSRYHPARNLHRSATDPEFLGELQGIAKEYVEHVYLGNLSGAPSRIICPVCKQENDRIGDGVCHHCKNRLYGVWN